MRTRNFLQKESQMLAKGNVTLKENSKSSEIISYFMRVVKGRTDLGSAVNAMTSGNDFLYMLEQIRGSLKTNEFEKVEVLFKNLIPQSEVEEGEVLLEKARLHLFKRDYAIAENYAGVALKMNGLPLQTTMSLFQVRGLIRTNLKDYNGAISDLKAAVGISDVLTFAHSAFSAYTVLAQAYSYSGDEQNARNTITLTKKFLESFQDDETWLARLYEYLRAEFHYHKCFGAKDVAFGYLMAAKTVAHWLGYKYAENMCDNNIAEFPKDQDCHFIKHFSDWSFVPDLKLVLIHNPKEIRRLDSNPLLSKILNLLSERPYELSELFEKVWEIGYKKERHHKHVHSILSKLRKKLPANALTVDNGIAILNSKL